MVYLLGIYCVMFIVMSYELYRAPVIREDKDGMHKCQDSNFS
jgi:hypothetical protein